MNPNFKGIEIVWLSETNLTNMNAGEGGSNLVDMKKFKKNGVEYPYVSGQAMRFYLKEAIRRNLTVKDYMCIPNDKGETCGDVQKCILCDLFGFMIPKKKKGKKEVEEEGGEETAGGALTRVSPVKVSPAVGLLSFDENSTLDFLTRKKLKEKSEEREGDIVNVEIGTNIYKCGIAIDIAKVGMEEKVEGKEIKMIEKVNAENRKDRIKKTIESIKFLADYSKQARLLTDFTPDIICSAIQNRYNHRLQKAFEFSEGKKINIKRLEEIFVDVKKYSDHIFFGMISGAIDNENEVREVMKKLGIQVMQPDEVIEKTMNTF